MGACHPFQLFTTVGLTYSISPKNKNKNKNIKQEIK
jgi:hypothetical protein